MSNRLGLRKLKLKLGTPPPSGSHPLPLCLYGLVSLLRVVEFRDYDRVCYLLKQENKRKRVDLGEKILTVKLKAKV